MTRVQLAHVRAPDRARPLRQIAAWINEHLTRHGFVATVMSWSVSTDRKPAGLRYITHKGKGRKGTRIRVHVAGRLVCDWNNAETYRTNDEVERWLARTCHKVARGEIVDGVF